MDINLYVGIINLFFVPVFLLHLHYRKKGRPLKAGLELLFHYTIAAALLIPLAKAFTVLAGRVFPHRTIPVDSGSYTLAALAAACLLYRLDGPCERLLLTDWAHIACLARRFRKEFFLFQKAPAPLWPLWKRLVYRLFPPVLFLIAGAWAGWTFLLLDAGPNWDAYLLLDGPLPLLLLNILPIWLLFLLFWAVTGRLWAGFMLGGGIAFGFSLANYYKIAFRDDPLIFKDLLLAREAGNMLGRFSPFIDGNILTVFLCFLGTGALLYFLVPRRERKPGWRKWARRGCAAGLAALLAAALVPVYTDDSLYASITEGNWWEPRDAYAKRGFLYPFLHSASSCAAAPPDGYSQDEALALLNAYTDAGIPDDRKINVIGLMRESYVDFSRYHLDGLDCGGYDIYHELESESYTGDLVTNIFGGGTVDTERCFLTGDYELPDLQENTNSYAWYLRGQGYTVEGSHPFWSWYYNRRNINAYLGFENYRFKEGDYELMTPSGLPEDSYLCAEIYNDYLKNKSTGKPYFNFSVTVEAHGVYSSQDEGNPLLLDERFSDECRYTVSNYLALLRRGDEALAELVDRLRDDPDPVVLVTFGDHLPPLDDSYYREIGLNLKLGTDQGFLNYYTTRYLIWANDAAKQILGHDMTGEGEAVSPCFLMNLLFRQLGWDGPAFMQAMDSYMGQFPVATTNGRYIADGVLTTEVPENLRNSFRDFTFLQYYWKTNFLSGA